ncbi:hypothetical protein HMPREF9182_0797 [Streptococcus sp. oral taxon 056 str. F0418]|nr:hypothetical protein HMPREF9182_0797 [Streptococcus sp. oral taxon 056 str. F0418]
MAVFYPILVSIEHNHENDKDSMQLRMLGWNENRVRLFRHSLLFR